MSNIHEKWILQKRPILPGPITHMYNKSHAPIIKIRAELNVHITTGTLLLTRIHKKVDLWKMKVIAMKDRKVHADKAKLRPGKEWTP